MMALVDSRGRPIVVELRDDQILHLMVEEIQALADGPAILMFELGDLFRIVGLLQLASRHPQLDPSNVETIDKMVDAAREYFKDCPTVLDVIRRGGDPADDRVV
jgi:hypothetical protein